MVVAVELVVITVLLAVMVILYLDLVQAVLVVAVLVAQYLAQVAVAVELPMVMVVLVEDTKRVQVDLVMAQTMALAAVVWAAKAVVMALWVQDLALVVL